MVVNCRWEYFGIAGC